MIRPMFRNKALKQIEFLGSKTFKDQSERIWLSLLRLSLDPVKKIAEMAQVQKSSVFLQKL